MDPGLLFPCTMTDEWIFVYASPLSAVNQRNISEIKRAGLVELTHSKSCTYFQKFSEGNSVFFSFEMRWSIEVIKKWN